MSSIPFFVADRPMSLRLLKSLPLQKYPNVGIGIMAHANTSLNFQHDFCQYPCDNFDYCDAVAGPCQYRSDISCCPVRKYILDHTIKMCDSGIFTREGATLTYQQLFEAYVRMGVEYGIMIDVFRNPQATLESAKEALKIYEPFKEKFKLVGVAQGTNIMEYIQNYEDLKKLGFSYIAIGGLLRKVEKSARYTQVRDQDIMFGVLGTLRDKYPEDWLFVLGSFHPTRLEKLQELNVWGDYKGWIFQYKKRNETLNKQLEVFTSNHLQHVDQVKGQEAADLITALQNNVALRNDLAHEQKNLSRQLFEGRQSVKTSLSSLYEETQLKAPEIATRLSLFITHGLLNDGEEKLVLEALQSIGLDESIQTQSILENIHKNRELKFQVESLEDQLNNINDSLARDISRLQSAEVQISEDTEAFCAKITALIESSERTYRFEQVRSMIEQDILALL
ncbi:MAG TPA: hypothetical protein VEP90_15325 [Methylomirabilota bacterium]|nr:hypothetical protein [Methylomirabilota bacterium]